MRVNSFVPSVLYCLWTIEGHALVDFSAVEVARLTSGLKDLSDLSRLSPTSSQTELAPSHRNVPNLGLGDSLMVLLNGDQTFRHSKS